MDKRGKDPDKNEIGNAQNASPFRGRFRQNVEIDPPLVYPSIAVYSASELETTDNEQQTELETCRSDGEGLRRSLRKKVFKLTKNTQPRQKFAPDTEDEDDEAFETKKIQEMKHRLDKKKATKRRFYSTKNSSMMEGEKQANSRQGETYRDEDSSPYLTRPKRARHSTTANHEDDVDLKPDLEELNKRIQKQEGTRSSRQLIRNTSTTSPQKSAAAGTYLYIPVKDKTNDSEIECTGMVLRNRRVPNAKNQKDSDDEEDKKGYESAPEYDKCKKARQCLAEKKRRSMMCQEKARIAKLEMQKSRLAKAEHSDDEQIGKKPSKPKTVTRSIRAVDALEAGYLSAPEMRSTRTRNSGKPQTMMLDFPHKNNRQSGSATKTMGPPAKKSPLKDEGCETKIAVPKETSTVEEKPVLDSKLPSISSSAKENKVLIPKRVQFMDVRDQSDHETTQLPMLEKIVPTVSRTRLGTGLSRMKVGEIIPARQTSELEKRISPIQKREARKLFNTSEKAENTYQMSSNDGMMASTSKSFPRPTAEQTKTAGVQPRRRRSELASLIIFPRVPESQLTPDSLPPLKDDAGIPKTFKIDTVLKASEKYTLRMSTRSSRKSAATEVNDDDKINRSSGSPEPKRPKLETPPSEEVKKEISPESENAPRVLRPRPVKEVVEVKRKPVAPKKVKQEMSNLNPKTAENTMSNLADRSLDKFSRPEEYFSVFETNVKLYHHVGSRKSRYFLQRNLFYKKGNIPIKLINEYKIGKEAPPLVFNRLRSQKNNCRKVGMEDYATKNERINTMTKILIKQKQGNVSHPTRLGISPSNKFSLGNLATAMDMSASNARAYFLRLIESKNARRAMFTVPKKIPKIVEKVAEKPSVLLTPGNSRESSIKSGVIVDSIVFTSCRHQTIPGKRVAWAWIYLAYERKGTISKPTFMNGCFFPLWVNGLNRTTIELVEILPSKSYDKCYIVVEVHMTKNLDSRKVEGHSLRARKQIQETAQPPKKKKYNTDFPAFENAKTELVFYGAVLYHEVNKGYNLGAMDIEIVPQSSIRNRKEKPGFVEAVLNEIKKNSGNPFLTTEARRLDVNDLSNSEDDENDEDEVIDEKKKQEELQVNDEKNKENTKNNKNTKRRAPNPRNEAKMRKFNFTRNFFDSFTGKFKWNNKGEYINDKEMCRFLFQDQKILNDMNKMKTINSWLPLKFPERLRYRFLCCTEPEAESYEPKKKLSSVKYKKPSWVVSDKNDHPSNCIFCERTFSSLYTLMLHYNLSYPRFAFVFSFRERDIDRINDSNPSVEDVFIDIMLDPNHVELNEVMPTKIKEPIRRPITQPKWLVTKKASRALRQTMRMDNTIFTRFLNVPEIVDETRRFITRFLDTNNGVPLTLCDKVNYDPKMVPQPAYEMLSEKQLRIVQDYIDIDQVTKNFMCTWNHLMIIIGRYNQNLLGAYLQHKLFLVVFWNVLNTEEGFREVFCTQLTEYTDAGVLSAEEQYDLWERAHQQDYNPLKDRYNSIYQGIIDYCALRYRAMRRAKKRGKPLNPLNYPRYVRRNVKRFTETKKDKLVEFCFWKTSKAIPRMDPRRLFMVDPIRKLTSRVNDYERLKKFFHTVQHTNMRAGEFNN